MIIAKFYLSSFQKYLTASTFLAAVVVFSSLCEAAVYYVSTSGGSDSNSGTEAAPWATVQKAAAVLTAGDTVYIKNGTYALNTHPTTKYLSPVKSGSSTAGWITFAAYPGHTPVLDGGNAVLPVGGLINIRNKEYIRISGLTVQNVDDNAEGIGIYVENSRHIIIEKNHVRHIDSSGIQVFTKSSQLGLPSADILIDGNDVEDTNLGGPNEMITVAGVNRFEVRNNRVHNASSGANGGEGIDIKQGAKNGSAHHNEIWDLRINRPGIYIDAWDQLTENIDIHSNHIHHVGTHGLYIGSERGGLLRNVRIYNNIVHDNYRAGIYFPDETSFSGKEPLEGIVVVNNTFARNGVSVNWFGAVHVANPSITGLIIRNNIAWQNGRYQIYDIPAGVSGAVVSDNLLWGTTGTADNSRVSSGADKKTDPLFVNAAVDDFHLQAASPAIDGGADAALPADSFDQDGDSDTAEPIPFDYADNPRRAGSRVDNGAYERSASVSSYTVNPSAGSGGTISPATAQTVNHGATVAFTVTPNSGSSISSVTGCGGAFNSITKIYTTGAITADCTVTASFITDADADGIDDDWERRYFSNLITADAGSDFDEDGYSDRQEYLNSLAGQKDPQGAEYDPKVRNAPGGTGYAGRASFLPAVKLLLEKK